MKREELINMVPIFLFMCKKTEKKSIKMLTLSIYVVSSFFVTLFSRFFTLNSFEELTRIYL